MLELIHRYANGFVAVPTMLSCRRRRVFEALGLHACDIESLTSRLNANAGHLQVAFRLLHSLGFIDCDVNGQWRPTEKTPLVAQIPDEIDQLLAVDMASLLKDDAARRLPTWLNQSLAHWEVPDDTLSDLLDGVLVVPLMIAIQKAGGPSVLEAGVSINGAISEATRAALREWFVGKKWGATEGGRFHLASTGRFLIERAMVNGVTASYAPMLRHLDDLLFGRADNVFADSIEEEERHVERTLNVVASGFQHQKYFTDLANMIRASLDSGELAVPPTHIVDVGCGDGTLLRTVYDAIHDHPAVSRPAMQRPLTLIGVDQSAAALSAASSTLAGAAHLLIDGELEFPHRLLESIQAQDPQAAEGVLHVRSFVDHDRTWKEPQNPGALSDFPIPLRGVYVDRAGRAISSARALEALVEHLQRWSEIVGEHGLLVLEVHSVAPELLRDDPETTNNLHFDALQAFSGQQLVEADVFLLAAARAGLLPRPNCFKRYPRITSYTHITLSWFTKRPFIVRLAVEKDLDALAELEEVCWPSNLRSSTAELASRLERSAGGNLVVDLNGRVVAVIYSQRIDSVDALASSSADQVGQLHAAEGRFVQLLALNVHPDFREMGLGDQLLDFMLQYSSVRTGVAKVVGVSRCRDYAGHGDVSLDRYIRQRDKSGRLVDPILRFHEQHGAGILGLIPHYRPEDRENAGMGVLIEYDLLVGDSYIRAAPRSTEGEHEARTVKERVMAAVQRVLELEELPESAEERTLTDLGCDSLQLQELHVLLCEEFDKPFDSTFFFRYGTIQSITEFLQSHDEKCSDRSASPQDVALQCNIKPKGAFAANESGPQSTTEKVAVIGIGCRFPGGADSPAEFWRLLAQGVDAVRDVPPGRWDIEALYDADPDAPGKMWSRAGAFLDNIDQFDAAFFGITPREAISLDPQQRVLLEVTWEALENAGLPSQHLAESQTGVFIGLTNLDYQRMAFADRELIDAYSATGTFASTCSGRLSYFLGVHGPCLTVDTACSSSLVAVHLACQSILSGESTLAIAGGVNFLFPEYSIDYTKARMLSPESRCKTFDASADGFVRGEGCGVIILKPLSQAEADGDQILAVILATGTNQDGKSNGLTAPNGLAQEQLLRSVLERAAIKPRQVGYVEAHGTGTSLGDPIEVGALTAVLRDGRDAASPLYLGSVKTNIGHLEAASGIAGMIKTILILQHKMIPAHLHLKQLNELIETNGVRLEIPQQLLRWESAEGRYIAGVSSYGFSGTNAHVLLESAASPAVQSGKVDRSRHLLCLSAKTDVALRELAERYDAVLAEKHDVIEDVCFTANTGRNHFRRRVAVSGSSSAEIRQELADAFRAQSSSGRTAKESPVLAFLFTGQGSQYPHMARELYDTQPTFRAALQRCDEILRPSLDHSLISVIFPKEFSHQGLINRTGYTQPALFALEYALLELWRSWGVTPSLVLGHSVGEYLAAYTAGVFSLEDGLQLISARARLMQSLPEGGAMAAVFGPTEELKEILRKSPHKMAIAAVNSPTETVISGSASAVQLAVDELRSRGIKAKSLPVSHAFHSPLLNPIGDEFRRTAEGFEYCDPQLPIVSNLTGRLYEGGAPMDADYWRRHMSNPVLFMRSLQTAQEFGVDAFLEIGPAATLSALGRQCRLGDSPPFLASLKSGMSDWACLLKSVGTLYAMGVDFDWREFDRPYKRSRVCLPTYPFQRQTYWLDQRSQHRKWKEAAPVPPTDNFHPLLGRRLPSPLDDIQFESHISENSPTFLADHRIRGRALFPAAAYLDLALSAARESKGKDSWSIADFTIHQPLNLAEKTGYVLHTIIRPIDEDKLAFSCFAAAAQSRSDNSWKKLASGSIIADSDFPRQTLADLNTVRCDQKSDPGSFYTCLRDRGYDYGPSFQAVTYSLEGADSAIVDIRLPVQCWRESEKYSLHPVVADACLQAAAKALMPKSQSLYLPVGWGKFSYCGLRPQNNAKFSACCSPSAHHCGDEVCVDIRLYDNADNNIAIWTDVRLLPLKDPIEVCELKATRGIRDEILLGSTGAEKTADHDLIEIQIRESLADIFALTSPHLIEADSDLFELGVDSLMAMDVEIAIEKMIGRQPPVSLLSQCRTLRELVSFVESQMETMPTIHH